MRHNARTPVFLSATVVAIGIAIAWAFVCGAGGKLIQVLFATQINTAQSLLFAPDGTVVVVTSTAGRRVYHTLDGKEIDLTDEIQWRYPSSLPNTRHKTAILHLPVPWQQRIGATSDYGNPATYWFLIRDDTVEGHAYFVGIDAATKREIGYLDRNGYRLTLPKPSDRFDLQDYLAGFDPPFNASTDRMEGPSTYSNFYERSSTVGEPPQWVMFFLDKDRIWRINLLERALSTFEKTNDAVSITMTFEPLLIPQNNTGNVAADGFENLPSQQRLAIRYRDRIEVRNLRNETRMVYPLPKRFREEKDIYAMSLGNGQLLLRFYRGYWEGGTQQELVWLDESGAELRNELVKLAGSVPGGPRSLAWQLAGVAPVPTFWAFQELIWRPCELLQWQSEFMYSAALSRTWRESWPACVAVLLLSAIAAWLAFRWHNQNYRSDGMLWTTFVFLLGVPGLVAYWLHFRGSPVATCASCGQEVPRDRDMCACCAEPFAEPALRGTEIFA